MADITLRWVADLAALEAPWRELEQRSSGSFFQGWTWTGCLAAERYSAPLLLQAHECGRLVALALFNRRAAWPVPGWLAPARLYLGETGDPAQDAVFVEHNGPLIAAGREALLTPLLAAALGAPIPGTPRYGRAVVVSGVGDTVLRAARSLPAACTLRQSRPAPFVALRALPPGDFLDTLGASTRYQLRRSARRYAESGALAVRRAGSVAEALAFLDAMAALHQATWTARGKPGAFADPAVMRFHRALVARGVPLGEVDLLRVSAGGCTIGYLYNVLSRHDGSGGWVGNYQGGFDYAAAGPHCKPGLTCHHLAIDFYRAEGKQAYDLLAGESRYKASLTSAHTTLHWLEIAPRRSLSLLIGSGMARLRRLDGWRPRRGKPWLGPARYRVS